jgi:hypothetical protein
MCLACQMEDELWFAYLDHVAQQEKKAAAEAVGTGAAEDDKPATPAQPAAPASPFVCEEQPSE